MSLLVRSAAAGLVLGAVWGVFLRVWMRLLVAYGEFTWAGTLLIIGSAACAGVGFALVRAARRSGRSPWWRAAALLAAPLVLFPQGVLALLPAAILGGWAVSGRTRRWGQILLLALTFAPLVVLVLIFEAEPTAMPLPLLLVVLATLMVLLAVAGAELFRPWRPTQPQPDGPPLTRLTTSSGVGS